MVAPGMFGYTRYEGARNQLNSAIKLWFENEDMVSTHMLAYHAHEMLHQIHRRSGGNLLFDSKAISESERKEFCLSLKAPANFFKHANDKNELDKDIKQAIDPTETLAFILMSIEVILQRDDPVTKREAAFLIWATINRPQWFSQTLKVLIVENKSIAKIGSYDREQFLDSFDLLIKTNPTFVEDIFGTLAT